MRYNLCLHFGSSHTHAMMVAKCVPVSARIKNVLIQRFNGYRPRLDLTVGQMLNSLCVQLFSSRTAGLKIWICTQAPARLLSGKVMKARLRAFSFAGSQSKMRSISWGYRVWLQQKQAADSLFSPMPAAGATAPTMALWQNENQGNQARQRLQ
jgi:hypothetical protein